jgi:hypothetical protein
LEGKGFGMTAPAPIGFIISEGGWRYERARRVIEEVGFRALHLPAVFVRRTPDCQGNNGVLSAMRNAWRIIAFANQSAAIFEDDIALPVGHSADEVRGFVQNFISHNDRNIGLGFLGWMESRGGIGTHAIWHSPDAARYLLEHSTGDCFLKKLGEGPDYPLYRYACRPAVARTCVPYRDCIFNETHPFYIARHGEEIEAREIPAPPSWRCKFPMSFRWRGANQMAIYRGFFGQDRTNTSAYLHKANLRAIEAQPVPKLDRGSSFASAASYQRHA